MKSLSLERRVEAAPQQVFALACDLETAHRRIRNVESIELLTPGPVTAGTRYRETRTLLGRRNVEDMEVVACEAPHSLELGTEAMGCRFRTRFSFQADGEATQMRMDFEVHPLTLAARMMLSALDTKMSQLESECAQDLDDLKAAAEAS